MTDDKFCALDKRVGDFDFSIYRDRINGGSIEIMNIRSRERYVTWTLREQEARDLMHLLDEFIRGERGRS